MHEALTAIYIIICMYVCVYIYIHSCKRVNERACKQLLHTLTEENKWGKKWEEKGRKTAATQAAAALAKLCIPSPSKSNKLLSSCSVSAQGSIQSLWLSSRMSIGTHLEQPQRHSFGSWLLAEASQGFPEFLSSLSRSALK